MSVAIFDDEGDYGAVIVSGANLAIAPGQISDALLSRGKVLVLQNEIPEARQRGGGPPSPRTRTDDHPQRRAGARLRDKPS